MKVRYIIGLAALVALGLRLVAADLTIAANNPYGIVKGVNGAWPIMQCGSGATPQSCTEHWVLGTGNQDPPSGFGSDGDLFWRTDLLAFRTKTAGVWGPLTLGSTSFPLRGPDSSGCVAPAYSFTGNTVGGLCRSASGQILISQNFSVSTNTATVRTTPVPEAAMEVYDGSGNISDIYVATTGTVIGVQSANNFSIDLPRGGQSEYIFSSSALTLNTSSLAINWSDLGLKRNTTNELLVSDASTGASRLAYRVPVQNFTGNNTLSAVTTAYIYTNNGAGGAINLTLPDNPAQGTVFEFAVMAAQSLNVLPNSGESIRDGASTGSTQITSNTVGNTIRLVAITGGSGAVWLVMSKTGTWTLS